MESENYGALWETLAFKESVEKIGGSDNWMETLATAARIIHKVNEEALSFTPFEPHPASQYPGNH